MSREAMRLPKRWSALVAATAAVEWVYGSIMLSSLLLGYAPPGREPQLWPILVVSVALLAAAWLFFASLISIVVSWRRGPSTGRNGKALASLILRILILAAPAVSVGVLTDWPTIRASDAGWLSALVVAPALAPVVVAVLVWRAVVRREGTL